VSTGPRGTFALGVGAQKAGTTWLHHYLVGSPQVARGYRKEYHVLDSAFLPGERWRDRNLDLAQAELDRLRRGEPADPVHLHRAAMIASLDSYCDYFTGLLDRRPRTRVTADVTPEYAALPVERLAAVRDGFDRRRVRSVALFLLRDPVERIWSQVRMQEGRQPGRFPAPPEEMVGRLFDQPNYERFTRYETTLRRLDEVWGSGDTWVGFYEELLAPATAAPTAAQVCGFLGIDVRPPDVDRRANASSGKSAATLPDDVVRRVATHYRDTYDAVARRFPDRDLTALWPSARFVR
jgi:hypothetical protein